MRPLLLVFLAALAGCASPEFDRRAATDACCVSPIPENWKDQKFAGSLRYRSITFCNVRSEAWK